MEAALTQTAVMGPLEGLLSCQSLVSLEVVASSPGEWGPAELPSVPASESRYVLTLIPQSLIV